MEIPDRGRARAGLVLARLGLSASLARRYLFGARSRLLVGTTRAALGSTGLGVTAMVIAMALMSGYTDELQRKLLQSGAILIYPRLLGGLGEDALGPGDPRPAELARLAEVESVNGVAYAQGSLASEQVAAGLDVVLRGVVPDTSTFGGSAEQLASSADGIAGAVLGRDLARRLHAEPGDLLRLTAISFDQARPRFRFKTLRMTGSFVTGFAQFDQSHVIVDRAVIESMSDGALLYEVVISDLDQAGPVRLAAEELLGEHYVVTDWSRQNPGLFTALRLQKWALFVTLGLIVVVSTFNVAATLVVLVREKTRDVGVLSALGLRPRQLEQMFLLCGAVLGGVGTLLGLTAGALVSWILTTFRLIRFDPEVAAIYFIEAVPFEVRPVDLLAVAAFSLGVTLLASWLPARRAASLVPAVALRYE